METNNKELNMREVSMKDMEKVSGAISRMNTLPEETIQQK